MSRALRAYAFPAARIVIYSDRTCREFPTWCPFIYTERPRAFVAGALRRLRQFHRRPRPSFSGA